MNLAPHPARAAEYPRDSGAALPAGPQRIDGSVIPAPPSMQRVEPGGSWTEPERRKCRFRLGDVASD